MSELAKIYPLDVCITLTHIAFVYFQWLLLARVADLLEIGLITKSRGGLSDKLKTFYVLHRGGMPHDEKNTQLY